MAIAFDAQSSIAEVSGPTTLTWSHNNVAGNVIVVGLYARDTVAGDRDPSSVTYNGVALTKIRADIINLNEVQLWYLLAPATGAHNVIVTFPNPVLWAKAGAITLTGVAQFAPEANNGAINGGSVTPSVSITTVADNAWVVDVVNAIGGPTLVAGAGQNSRWQEVGFGSTGSSTEGPVTPAGATTMSWTVAPSSAWAISAASFAPIIEITPATVFGQGIVSGLAVPQIVIIPDQRLQVITPGLAEYKVILKNPGTVVAEFDTWVSLSFTHLINQRGSIRFEINGNDNRNELFVTDGQLEVWRRNQIMDLDWYLEWEGFVRTKNTLVTDSGIRRFVAYGFSYLDLANRAEVLWPPGSDQVIKSAAAETAMKELVNENIGPAALLADGRLDDNVMQGLAIEGDTGAGATWGGAVGDENLMNVLEDISLFTASQGSPVDFDIVGTNPAEFEFRTYVGQRGASRTKTNTDGNAPVVFGLNLGNMILPVLSENRSTIADVIYAIGAGTDDTRIVASAQDNSELAESPWNRIERSIAGGSSSQGCDITAQLLTLTKTELEKNRYSAQLNFSILQSRASYYGKHYFWGDRITAEFDGQNFDKKISEVRVTVSDSAQGEDIVVEFTNN